MVPVQTPAISTALTERFDEQRRQLALLVLGPRSLLRSSVPAAPGDDDDVGLARDERRVGGEGQPAGGDDRRLTGRGDQAHRKVDAELTGSSQDLVRTQRVQLVQSVKDHDVGEHDLSVEEVLAN